MSHTMERKPAACPHCGSPLEKAAAPADPALQFADDLMVYDLEALAAEAAEDKAFDESAKVRVTQQDIRKLLENRRKDRK